MRWLLRACFRLALGVGLTTAAAAAGRALIGRLSGEPGGGVGPIRTASFDSWPAVPTAPEPRTDAG